MCERAKEIQASRAAWWDDGDFFYHELRVKEAGGYSGGSFVECNRGEASTFHEEYYGKSKRWVWLPRQDQLQEMAWDPSVDGSWWKLAREFGQWAADMSGLTNRSLEQLWLLFVMERKFQKRWDGCDWVAA